MKFENYDLCKACGGKCCKKSGCDYYTSDFLSLTKASLIEILDTGNVSIVSASVLKTLNDGRTIIEPILYLRARNIGRGVVDLLSFKKQCSMLTSEGCFYTIDERPSGGVHLIPHENNQCKRDNDPKEELYKWLPYQNILAKMVKRYSNMSVDACLREDAENLFKDIFNENFEGVAKEELEDILDFLPYLISSFPEEYKRAKTSCLLTSKILRRI